MYHSRILILALSLGVVQQGLPLYGPGLDSPQPKNMVIAFDLHGVVLNPDYKRIFNYAWYSLHKTALIKTLPYSLLRLMRSADRSEVYEAFFDYLFENSPQKDMLVHDFTVITNMQKINTDTINIIKELKNAGYIVILASNIGENTYNDLVQKPEMAQVMTLFNTIIIPRPINNYAHKPDSRYFEMLINHYPHKHIVLIDDSFRNLCGAAKNGISGIGFKSAAQLKELLTEHNFFNEQKY